MGFMNLSKFNSMAFLLIAALVLVSPFNDKNSTADASSTSDARELMELPDVAYEVIARVAMKGLLHAGEKAIGKAFGPEYKKYFRRGAVVRILVAKMEKEAMKSCGPFCKYSTSAGQQCIPCTYPKPVGSFYIGNCQPYCVLGWVGLRRGYGCKLPCGPPPGNH